MPPQMHHNDDSCGYYPPQSRHAMTITSTNNRRRTNSFSRHDPLLVCLYLSLLSYHVHGLCPSKTYYYYTKPGLPLSFWKRPNSQPFLISSMSTSENEPIIANSISNQSYSFSPIHHASSRNQTLIDLVIDFDDNTQDKKYETQNAKVSDIGKNAVLNTASPVDTKSNSSQAANVVVNASAKSPASNITKDHFAKNDTSVNNSATTTFTRSDPFTETSTSNTTNVDASNANRIEAEIVKKDTRTLYDILGASKDDSKAEIKRKYILLARMSHPDATRGSSVLRSDLDFSEIAAAYRVLSNTKERKRYDRALQAEAWSREIQDFAEKFSEQAAPKMRSMIDTVAMPFFRRTTATTLAGIQAAARDFSTSKNASADTQTDRDFGKTFMSAMRAAQRAGRMVDNLELMEKSKELEKQVLQQIENANKIKTELESVAMMRCQLALRVPNASFTSTDAFNLLEYWNITDSSLSILERAMLKNPINKKIQELETLEMAMDEIVNEYRDADMDLRSKEKSLQDARSKGVLAIQSEKRAREALQQAKLRITESKANVNQSTKALVQADMMLTRKGVDKEEAHANYKSWEEALQKARAESTLALQTETRAREALDQAKQEVKETKAIVNAAVKILAKSESFLGRRKMERDRLSNSVSKQQEIVRRSMQKKESEMGISDSQDNEIATWTKLKELERKEQDLIKQYDQLEVMATRTQSRANKLKRRAELLKNMD